MLQVIIAFVFAVVGILMKGLLNLSLAYVAVSFAIPIVFLYKLFGNRQCFLLYAAIIGAFAGGVSAFYGCVIVPIQYYYSIWDGVGSPNVKEMSMSSNPKKRQPIMKRKCLKTRCSEIEPHGAFWAVIV